MNKYSFDLPYDYTQYASVRGYVFADTEEEALEKAKHHENWFEEEYEDSDNSGDSYYNYEDLEVELEEEDVILITSPPSPSEFYPAVSEHFLAEIYLV